MTDGRPDAGQQLVCAEGLGQIVVGPQIQGVHLVPLMGPGRDHHHWQTGPGAQLTQDVQTIHIGQSQIQDDQIGTVRGNHGLGLGAGAGHHRVIVMGGEHRGDEVADALLVLNNQDLVANFHSGDRSFLDAGRPAW